MRYLKVHRTIWENKLEEILEAYQVYASLSNEFSIDYELLTKELIPNIAYNTPKPVTPLKNFFLPVKEDVSVSGRKPEKRVIMGIPHCDLAALNLLDEIYLDKDFIDPFYRNKREEFILISSDCFSNQEHCHCTSYGINPFTEEAGDIAITLVEEIIVIAVFTAKGEKFIGEFFTDKLVERLDTPTVDFIKEKRNTVINQLNETNKGIPDYKKTRDLLIDSKDEIWKKYASTCVSCGACASICPTCSCFLLIDRPEFKKTKQLDACQYPGFERVAGGEDPLHHLFVRFRNRYLCKYVWKPQGFNSIACTGCGRCIEACIGKINKNELFIELTN